MKGWGEEVIPLPKKFFKRSKGFMRGDYSIDDNPSTFLGC
jgi:hypothetical protein